ncbi:tryptophan synthase subunit alpha [Altibacter sp. HG106]|uniref:tryptophan synthase subunit alpha n=1 Tax=Altibacter sp. HG106 TaxID=3023937 RepID=UPI0023500661|nr:tryptophan synthase subunit alpha [Altibacter sp. HG106]MDC7996165.1 tryptophan synthase subunit alpha [Altibacter sp. HG106]
MNRIDTRFNSKKKIVSIYLTAGYPNLEDTVNIIQKLEQGGADMIEIGLPFSDPLADGPTIQESSTQALQNGMTTQVLFEQLKHIRETVSIPLLLMGYFNPILQYGVERFCEQCALVGIDGLIIPDLPLREYKQHYEEVFQKHGLHMIFLITPQTSEARIRDMDEASNGFLYVVSSASTTGKTTGFSAAQQAYLQRVSSLQLRNRLLVGFGIHDAETFQTATKHTHGAIIGSAFINHLKTEGRKGIASFLQKLRGAS